MIEEWYAMGKARSIAEFKAAMSRMAIPMFNAMYADRDGNIFYVYNGAVPRRSTKFDWAKPVDGSNPETEWQGFHTFEELPQLTNPKTGFFRTAIKRRSLRLQRRQSRKESFPTTWCAKPTTRERESRAAYSLLKRNSPLMNGRARGSIRR